MIEYDIARVFAVLLLLSLLLVVVYRIGLTDAWQLFAAKWIVIITGRSMHLQLNDGRYIRVERVKEQPDHAATQSSALTETTPQRLTPERATFIAPAQSEPAPFFIRAKQGETEQRAWVETVRTVGSDQQVSYVPPVPLATKVVEQAINEPIPRMSRDQAEDFIKRNPYYSVRELQELTGVPYRTIARWKAAMNVH